MTISEKEKFEQWARQICTSDEGAFSELFHEVYPRLVKYAWKYTKRKTSAHDIVQEVFINLWEARKNIDPKRSLLSYLYKMTKNQSLNYLRDSTTNEVPLDELSASEVKMDDKWTAEIEDESGDDVKMLALIAALPNRQREAIKLSRFEGLSHDEIAYVMEISPRTVNNHIVTAIHSLKRDWNNCNTQKKRGSYDG